MLVQQQVKIVIDNMRKSLGIRSKHVPCDTYLSEASKIMLIFVPRKKQRKNV